jgi:hypothetical protein
MAPALLSRVKRRDSNARSKAKIKKKEERQKNCLVRWQKPEI